MSFAQGAVRLAAAAAQLLRWTPDTFWNATPSDLANALGSVEEARVEDPDVLAHLRALMNEREGCNG